MDGWITIGIKLIDKLDEELKNAKSKLEKYNKDAEKETTTTAKVDTSKAEQSINKLEQKSKEIKDIWADYTPPEFVDEISFNEQIKNLKDKIEEIREWIRKPAEFGFSTREVEELNLEEEKLTNQLEKLIKKQQELNNKINEGKKNTESHNNSMSKLLKKIAKWTLAIFGVRSAYMAIRSAMGILTQYDDQMAVNLEYIRYALAEAIKPVIEWIIKAVVKLLQYVNYLYKAWFGNDLFASAKAFEDMKKSSAGVAKNAKEIKKQLAGFDEMNILEDTSASSTSDSIGSIGPDINLTDDFEVPKWLEKIKEWGQWIIDHWPIVLGVLAGTAAVFGIAKLVKWLKKGKEIKDVVGGWSTTFKGFFDGLGKGIEAIAILGGFALVIKSITDLIDTFAKSNLKVTDVLGLMGTIIGSLVILITSLTLATKALQSPSAMAGLLALTGSISAILLVVSATLPTILDACSKFINDIGPFIIKLIDTINNGITTLIYALGTTLPPIINSVGDLFTKVFNGISKVIDTVGNTMVNILNTAKNLVTTVLSAILNFINNLGPAINSFVDGAIQAVTKLINFLISGIEYMVNTLIIDAINSLISKVNKIPLVDVPKIPKVSITRFTPKLAKGGIISQPGRGVPLALGGEGGTTGSREGVIPLTDSQQMNLLGEAIGRYITVNLTNVTKLDNRQIAREQKIINSQNDFAYNR